MRDHRVHVLDITMENPDHTTHSVIPEMVTRYHHDRYERHHQSSATHRSRSPEPGFRRPRTPILTAQHYQPSRDDRGSPGRDRRPLTPPHKSERHHIPSREDREEMRRPLTSVLVSALTPNVTTPHLQEIFSFYGPISSINVPINPQSGLTRGIAYIDYSCGAGCPQCCQSHGQRPN